MDARSELMNVVYPTLMRKIENGEHLTPEQIRNLVVQFSAPVALAFPDLPMSPADIDAVAKEIETRVDIQIDPDIVVNKDHEPWLDMRRRDIDPYYWDRYRAHLGTKGFPPSVIAELGAGTDGVLDQLRNPISEAPWDRRGLVMGNVQSGKTAHYTGLVCKAADAGFKVIIIIAGIHNNLRNQTQGRIDQGFIGEHRVREGKSVRRELLGVGLLNADRRPVGFTSSNQDFTKATADAMGVPFDALNEPAVFVIKKNPSTLKHLLDWLKPSNSQPLAHPMLLIDDEADNASINIRYSKDEISGINKQIRQLLDLFAKSAYVGYTATPFANIFIDPSTDENMLLEDLFPRSFIVSMDSPSNYMGPTRVFLDEPDTYLRWIEDSADILPTNHKKDHTFAHVPESLIDALRGHVLARAVRIIRGDGAEHSSMLINASRFVSVQAIIRQRVAPILQRIQDAARLNHALPMDRAEQDPEIAHLRRVFESEYSQSGVEWRDVLAQLWESAAPIRLALINGSSADRLDYDAHPQGGLHVIAVGGLALSRGLTLEGLMTTYFLRNSQMYDTLLQMGRWFGYRPNYEDLCRIHMPEDVAGWYAHIAESVDELREELRRMARDGRSPEDFGLKVRSHPAALIVTARNKMGAAESRTLRIGLAERNVQTTSLSKSSRSENIECAARFLQRLNALGLRLEDAEPVRGGLLVQDVPLAEVQVFLEQFQNDSYSMLADPGSILDYIDGRTEELESWDLFVPSLSSPGEGGSSSVLGPPLNLRSRKVTEFPNRVEFRKANFVDPGDERAGLSDEEIKAAEETYREEHPSKTSPNYPAICYRRRRIRPQLGLHLLNLFSGDESSESLSNPWLAWNISFPGTREPNATTTYVVNPIWISDFLVGREDEDDSDDD